MASSLIRWCLANANTLSLESFVNKFGFTNKETANRQYVNTLNSAALSHLENINELKSEFKLWRHSQNETRFWRSLTTENLREETSESLTKNVLRLIKRKGDEEQERISNRSSHPNADDPDNEDLVQQPSQVSSRCITSKEFRKTVYVNGYNIVKELSLKGQTTLESVAELNTMARQLKPVSLGESLDHLSKCLISSKPTSSNKEALKLSLSKLVYVVGGDMLPIFDDFFQKDPCFQRKYEQAKADKPQLPDGLTAEMSGVFDRIVKEASKGKLKARKLICQKRMDIFESGQNDNELMQLLDIVDTLIAGLPDLNERSSQHPGNNTELTHYRHVAVLLDILFRDTNFEMKDGETCSKATKTARQSNMEICKDNDNKQVVIGRRIDLLISTMGVELGSSEWKKASVSKSLGMQQQNKNARTNKAILRALEKMSIDEENRSELVVYGMDWLGSLGYMIAVKQVDSAYFVYCMGDLILPQTLFNLKDFKDTLNLLFAFKHHHQGLQQIVEPAYHRQIAQSTLQNYRMPSADKRSPSPDTFFTPVKKQRTKIVFIEEENDDTITESEAE